MKHALKVFLWNLCLHKRTEAGVVNKHKRHNCSLRAHGLLLLLVDMYPHPPRAGQGFGNCTQSFSQTSNCLPKNKLNVDVPAVPLPGALRLKTLLFPALVNLPTRSWSMVWLLGLSVATRMTQRTRWNRVMMWIHCVSRQLQLHVRPLRVRLASASAVLRN